jgi:hypothetical protein
MGRSRKRTRTRGGRHASVAEAPWKASSSARSTPDAAGAAAQASPLTLSADTDLDVLMAALLGTSPATPREPRKTDVESRLAKVLEDVGLASDAARAADVAPAPAARAGTPALATGGAPAHDDDCQRPRETPLFSEALAAPSPRRWLWFAVPVLLAVAVAGWLSRARVMDGHPGGAERAPQTTSAK